MKKTIVFGSLLAVFILLMIPNISAVEYNTVVEAHESYIIQRFEIKENELNELIESIKDGNIENFSIIRDILRGILSSIFGIISCLFLILSGIVPWQGVIFFVITYIFILIYWIIQLIDLIG